MAEWTWCLHCERCYEVGKHRVVEVKEKEKGEIGAMIEAMGITHLKFCHYEDCDGGYPEDAWDWTRLQEMRGYPTTPEYGKVYPQYGPHG